MSAGAGTSFEGGADATIGTLWIQHCEAREVSPRKLEVVLDGKAWRWLDRETDKAWAEFEVSQYLRFGFDATVTGQAEFAYAPDKRVATVWFKPSDDVTTHFRPLHDVRVDEGGLWSEIVGTAAAVTGKSPEQRANQKVERKGERKLRSKAAGGFSYVYDLCTSRSYTRTGMLATGELPEPAVKYRDDRDYLVNSDAVVHEGGLVLVGPFERPRPLVAEVVVPKSSATIAARMVCDSDAAKLAVAFLEQRELPTVQTLARTDVPAGGTRSLTAPAQGCPGVLAIELGRGESSRQGQLKYSVYHEGEQRRPLARCDGDGPHRY